MKIVFLSIFHFSNYTGGNEVYADTLAREHVSNGHQVTYLATHGNESIRYPYKLLKIRSIFQIFKHISELKPDVVHTSGSGIWLSLTGLFCRIFKIPCVSTFQAPLRSESIFQKINKLSEWFDVMMFNKIIVTSASNKEYLKKYLGKNKIHVIHLAIKNKFPKKPPLSRMSARKKLNLDENSRYILVVSKLDNHHYYKGIDISLDAIKELDKRYKLLICGTGNLKDYYKNKVKEMALSDQVEFLGHVSDKLLPIYYVAADVFILPSISNSEGFGLVLLEAMLMETPTITTEVVGISSILKQKQASMVIPAGSSKDLADAIKEVIKNRKSLIKNGKIFALSCSIEKMTSETVNVYKKAINK